MNKINLNHIFDYIKRAKRRNAKIRVRYTNKKSTEVKLKGLIRKGEGIYTELIDTDGRKELKAEKEISDDKGIQWMKHYLIFDFNYIILRNVKHNLKKEVKITVITNSEELAKQLR